MNLKVLNIATNKQAYETLTLQEGSEHCYTLKAFLSELVGQLEFPISIYTDSKSLAKSLLSTNTIRDKRLNMDMASLCEMLKKKKLRESSGSQPNNS